MVVRSAISIAMAGLLTLRWVAQLSAQPDTTHRATRAGGGSARSHAARDARVPLRPAGDSVFIENRGRCDDDVRHLLRCSGLDAGRTDGGVVTISTGSSRSRIRPGAVGNGSRIRRARERP